MTLRVTTHNILAQAYIKPERYPHSPPESLEEGPRRERLIELHRALDSTLFALQEIEPETFSILEAAFPEHVGVYAQRTGKPDGSALFAHRSLSAEPAHTLVYQHHDPKTSQLALTQVFSLPDGRTLGVASTHLQWQKDSTPAHRHLGRLQLLELLDFADTRPEVIWLLCGDFNAISQSLVLEAALSRGWRLSCRSQRPWDTVNIHGRRRKLDYLLYREGELSPRPMPLPKLARDTPMPSMDHPSDHLAVTIEI